jgi:hypothetical protein
VLHTGGASLGLNWAVARPDFLQKRNWLVCIQGPAHEHVLACPFHLVRSLDSPCFVLKSRHKPHPWSSDLDRKTRRARGNLGRAHGIAVLHRHLQPGGGQGTAASAAAGSRTARARRYGRWSSSREVTPRPNWALLFSNFPAQVILSFPKFFVRNLIERRMVYQFCSSIIQFTCVFV